MSSHVLITGATGFIGRRLTRDLVRRGYDVRVLARDRTKARELFGDSVEVAVGEMGNEASLLEACRGREFIYHIAGSYRFGLRHRRELRRINVDGTEKLLSSAAAAGAGRIVHLSSASVLERNGGGPPGPALLDERDFPSSPARLCPYKSSKWQAEQRVLAWARKGLPVSIASTTCPIGDGDETPTPTGRMIQDFLRRRFPCYCRTGLNFIGVGDLCEGLRQVAESGRTGERYLICDENLWLKEFLDLLAEETGLSAPRVCLPDWMIRLIGFGGESFDLLKCRGANARVCLETALQAGQVQFFSNAKARTELEWKPSATIRKSIHEAIQWFRGQSPLEFPHHAAASVQSHVQ